MVIIELIEEVWQEIPGFNGLYEASNLGFVRRTGLPIWSDVLGYYRTYKTKILSNTLHESGYLICSITIDGKTKSYKVHHLIWAAFHGWNDFKISGLVIDHKNNIPIDCRLLNLQLVTNRVNCTKDKFGYSSPYVGVTKVKNKEKYVARINYKVDGVSKLHNIGTYSFETDAAAAYQKTLSELK